MRYFNLNCGQSASHSFNSKPDCIARLWIWCIWYIHFNTPGMPVGYDLFGTPGTQATSLTLLSYLSHITHVCRSMSYLSNHSYSYFELVIKYSMPSFYWIAKQAFDHQSFVGRRSCLFDFSFRAQVESSPVPPLVDSLCSKSLNAERMHHPR